ncbi:unnamed protein product [Chilo suppressalis]|uniref:Odorant receptor n=1 Tax=Chilo suppressalis TaxID=168631 RepID=A0ABN8AYP8_CHISP|nr:unnamed protein product [Chilo suppressalis]
MQGKLIDLPIRLPFDPNTKYYTAALYVWIQTSWLAYCNTAADVFISILLEQCRTQVTILRYDLENVVQKSKEEATETHGNYGDILERKFREMLLHHKEIVKTAGEILDIFSGAVFYQFLVSGWILCTSAYKMVNMNPASIEYASMISYIICVSIQLYVYCYYGNEINYESRRLTDSAYVVDWLEIPVRQRKTLIIFMERIKQPIEPMAGTIIPLSNSTYVSVSDIEVSLQSLHTRKLTVFEKNKILIDDYGCVSLGDDSANIWVKGDKNSGFWKTLQEQGRLRQWCFRVDKVGSVFKFHKQPYNKKENRLVQLPHECCRPPLLREDGDVGDREGGEGREELLFPSRSSLPGTAALLMWFCLQGEDGGER